MRVRLNIGGYVTVEKVVSVTVDLGKYNNANKTGLYIIGADTKNIDYYVPMSVNIVEPLSGMALRDGYLDLISYEGFYLDTDDKFSTEVP